MDIYSIMVAYTLRYACGFGKKRLPEIMKRIWENVESAKDNYLSLEDCIEELYENGIDFKISIDEAKQLKELDKLKNDPNTPNIKIHLSQGEMDEIYSNVETEILDVYGINGDVESRVSFWVNQKIRDNQSEARGRLNSLKRDFSNLTQLSKNQQLEFIYQIEFYINENMLKPYDITEENIITLSKSFKNYGKLKL